MQKSIYISILYCRKRRNKPRVFTVIRKKASSGVEVKLSVDRVGGYKLKKKVISRLKENGVKFTFSKTETEKYVLFFASTKS